MSSLLQPSCNKRLDLRAHIRQNCWVRRVVVLLAVGLLSVTLLVGGGTWWVLRATVRAFEPARWSNDGVPIEEAGRVFGVRFSTRPGQWRSRQVNVQDASFEALAELGDEAQVQAFVALNHLEDADDEDADVAAHEEELGLVVHRRRVLQPREDERFERTLVLLVTNEGTWLAASARER